MEHSEFNVSFWLLLALHHPDSNLNSQYLQYSSWRWSYLRSTQRMHSRWRFGGISEQLVLYYSLFKKVQSFDYYRQNMLICNAFMFAAGWLIFIQIFPCSSSAVSARTWCGAIHLAGPVDRQRDFPC